MQQFESLLTLSEDVSLENCQLEEKLKDLKMSIFSIICIIFFYIVLKVICFSLIENKSVSVQIVSWIMNLIVYAFLIVRFIFYRKKYSRLLACYEFNKKKKKELSHNLAKYKQEKEFSEIENLIIEIRMQRMITRGFK